MRITGQEYRLDATSRCVCDRRELRDDDSVIRGMHSSRHAPESAIASLYTQESIGSTLSEENLSVNSFTLRMKRLCPGKQKPYKSGWTSLCTIQATCSLYPFSVTNDASHNFLFIKS